MREVTDFLEGILIQSDNTDALQEDPFFCNMSKEKVLAYMRKQRFGGHWDEAMERAGWKCEGCGMTNDQHIALYGRNLTVDHIDGQGRYADIPNNTLANLQVLCLKCHGAKDGWQTGKYAEWALTLGMKFEIIRKTKPTAGTN